MDFAIVIGAFPIVIGAVPQLSAHLFRFGVLHVDPSMITTVRTTNDRTEKFRLESSARVQVARGRERSVSRAAEKLFISQPAMSHVLLKLRRHLDDPILVKTSIGMVPTPRAQALLEPVIDLLRDAERIIGL